MDKNNNTTIIEGIELARERKSYPEALSLAEQLIVQSVLENNGVILLNALAHKLLIYKNQYFETQNILFNELMFGDIETGFAIADTFNITGQPKAVILLRAGDYYFIKKEYEKATDYYAQALGCIDKKNSGECAEYLGHYAQCIAKQGNIEESIQKLEQALKMAETDISTRHFHKLIQTSGILFRLCEVYSDGGQTDKAVAEFEKGMEQAKVLKNIHEMPMRFIQGQKLQEQLRGLSKIKHE